MEQTLRGRGMRSTECPSRSSMYPDCANVEVVQRDDITHDEISQFLESRYVSPPGAFWSLYEYPLHGQSHTVKVHNLGDVLSKLRT